MLGFELYIRIKFRRSGLVELNLKEVGFIVGGKGRGSSIQEGASHIYTFRLG